MTVVVVVVHWYCSVCDHLAMAATVFQHWALHGMHQKKASPLVCRFRSFPLFFFCEEGICVWTQFFFFWIVFQHANLFCAEGVSCHRHIKRKQGTLRNLLKPCDVPFVMLPLHVITTIRSCAASAILSPFMAHVVPLLTALQTVETEPNRCDV